MQKMIIGLIVSALGGGGFIYAMGNLLTIFGNTSDVGWGVLYEASINVGVTIALVCIVLFVAGLALIVSDNDARLV